MRIAVIGTRGIPNNYGGFEQCAEYLALGLVGKGHEVIVYNSHNHDYQSSKWNGVEIVHKYDPEHKAGTLGQFIYDLNCILDVRKRNCDIILQLGYTSSTIWGWLLPAGAITTTNMDGLEWKRSKYHPLVQRFLTYAEGWGIKYSDYLISDSVAIQKYLKDKYSVDSTFIPYGADEFVTPCSDVVVGFGLVPYQYDLLIARLEPENSLEIVLDGVAKSGAQRPFLVVGNNNTKYGSYLVRKYLDCNYIRFLGGIYDIDKLNHIRYYSNIYFHGHTVGGTNPSLLEAMASGALISAHNNNFNKSILGRHALYFQTSDEVAAQLETVDKNTEEHQSYLNANLEKIRQKYSWKRIVHQYEEHFEDILGLQKIPASAMVNGTLREAERVVAVAKVPPKPFKN